MQGFASEFSSAIALIFQGDSELWAIVLLSLKVSMFAVLISALIGMPVGAALAVARFPGRRVLIVLMNALMGFPPVVVGLLVYLMLSRSGPLGVLELLYTPTAMIIAQVVLVTPIVAALTRQVIEMLAEEYSEQLRSLGVSRLASVPVLTVGCAVGFGHSFAGRVWTRHCRSGGSDHRRWQHQSCDTRDDNNHRAGNLERKSGACVGVGRNSDRDCRGRECNGQRRKPEGRAGGVTPCVMSSAIW